MNKHSKDKYPYVPEVYKPGDSAEFHRIREWWNTFNAALAVELSRNTWPVIAEDIAEAKREARRVANSVHGRIRKPKPAPSWGRAW